MGAVFESGYGWRLDGRGLAPGKAMAQAIACVQVWPPIATGIRVASVRHKAGSVWFTIAFFDFAANPARFGAGVM